MNSLTTEQFRRNSESRLGWGRYRAHRERITQLLLQAAGSSPHCEVCVLGAGNCNDLDLHAMLAAGLKLHLVDLDPTALTLGVERQSLAGDERIACHGGVDLTGLWDVISKLSPSAEIDRVQDVAQRLLATRPTYDLPTGRIVLSIGLLSQLVEAAMLTIGEQHPSFLDLVQALRLQHLRLATSLVEPGGTLIVTSEIVSTATAPQIASVREDELPSILSMLLLEGNFFTGLHPGLIGQTLRLDPEIASQLINLKVEGPWLWEFTARSYAVCGFVAQRP